MTAGASRRLLCVALAWALLAGCSRESAPPTPGDRIVVLSPALAVVLCDLGLKDRIVGRHQYDLVLDPGVPVCGEQGAINYEALLRARPTHVLTEWGSRELPRKLAEMAAANGWSVHDFSTLTLEQIDASAAALGAMFEGAAPSPRVSRLHELATRPTPPPVWEGRVLLLMSVSPIAALGPGSAHDELLRRVGGVPVIERGSPYMQLHAEDVARLAPDAIVLVRPGGGETGLGALEGLGVPALREGRVGVVTHRLALIPSTALGEVADEMEGLLQAWAKEP